MDAFPGLSFARPEALLLLVALVPLAVYLSRTSMALLRRGRRRWSLGLRIAIITLLVLSLCGLGIITSTDRLSVVYLLDHSDSIGTVGQAQQATFVRKALDLLEEGDEAGVIVFGGDALVDRPVLPDKAPPDLASTPLGGYTNLADAIRLGLAMMPADTARRLVLLSDGRENLGDAEEAARLVAAHGVSLDVVSLARQGGPDVWVESLKAPSPVRENERVSLQISISSSADTTSTLLLLMDGEPIGTQEISLTRGDNTFVQDLPPAATGFHQFEARVIPPAGVDSIAENNAYSAYTLVLGKSRLLLVEGHAGEAAQLQAALGATANVDLVTPANMPADAKGLVGYDGVVLVNVPATSLTSSSMAGLQSAVRELGKGLIVVGGDESYATGGYFRTPLEAMLPVDLNLPSKLDIPSVGMPLVIDRSGSMESAHSASGAGVKKIELAKEAAYRAVAQLSDRDYVGVITFDSAANWVIPMQPLGDPTKLQSRIGGITSGGGTNIYAGLAPAVDALIASKAKSRHIVLLTDGVSEGGDYEGLVAKMSANNITLSTVAVGADADTGLLKALASAGKGRYYYTEDGNALPQIFAQESHLAARSYIIEHSFTPGRTSPSPILEGLGGLPALNGYVGTSQKAGGQIVLVTDAGDPLLAQWQYGLGRVIAWTSDATGRWAKEWIPWQDYQRFWAQAVRWSTGAEAASALQPGVTLEGGMAHITVDATAPDGRYLNDLSTGVAVLGPGQVTATVQLRQTGAGRYEGRFPVPQEGAYLVQVQAGAQDGGKLSQTLGVVVPYSPEYRGGASDNGLLVRLASVTGGRVLTLEGASASLDHNLSAAKATTELWPLFLLLAILLLPLDVGVRRVAMSRADVARALRELRGRLGLDKPQPALAPGGVGASTPEMSALFSAKNRTRERLSGTDEGRRTKDEGERPSGPIISQSSEPGTMSVSEPNVPAPPKRASSRAPTPSTYRPTPQAAEPETLDGEANTLAARLRKAREMRR
ncbi:MAG TPA: VWA domain-containing protein [Chloroflexia bacterium]|nr:VWA domain-containing protein [Chloroflexia bacterium]